MANTVLNRKMRRRILRFINTGEPQARVQQLADVYQYAVKHGELYKHYKLTKMGKLVSIKVKTNEK